jgi:hypothetical protein
MQHTDALVEAHQAAQAIAHQRASDSSEAHAEALDECIERVVSDTLTHGGELMLPVLESSGPSAPIDTLLENLSADTLEDWLRLLSIAPIADLDIVVVNMRGWMEKKLRESADVQAEAETLLAAGEG